MTLSGKLAKTTIMISLYFIVWICVTWTSVSPCFHLLTASVFSPRCCSPDWSEWCRGRGRSLWWWVLPWTKQSYPLWWWDEGRCDNLRNTYLRTENRLQYTPRENTNNDKDIINCCVWLPEMSTSSPRAVISVYRHSADKAKPFIFFCYTCVVSAV